MKTLKQIHGTAVIIVDGGCGEYAPMFEELKFHGAKGTMVQVLKDVVFILYHHDAGTLFRTVDGFNATYLAHSPNRRQLCRWMHEYLSNLNRKERGRVRRVILAN